LRFLLAWLCGEKIMEIRLNLIPKKRKDEINKRNRASIIFRIETFFATVLAIFLVMLLVFNYILNLNLNSTIKNEEKNGNSEKYEQLKDYDAKFNQINRKLADVISIKNDQLYWSKLFLKLNSSVFPGIEIKVVNTSDYLIRLMGISDTRDNLILFKEKLSSDECFSNINLPLDDLVEKNNISFEIDFLVDKNCLKNK